METALEQNTEYGITPEIRRIERSDDPLFNFKYLYENKDYSGEFEPQAEDEVLQNVYSEYAESNVRHHVPIVEHTRESEENHFMAFGRSTVQNAIIGLNAVEVVDETSRNQFLRSRIEAEDEVWHNDKENIDGMSKDKASLFLSPAPTPGEMDMGLAKERYGYDGRMMIRMQTVSPDKLTKYMYSASVFGVPIEAVAKFQAARGREPADNTALAVMESSLRGELSESSPEKLLYDTLSEIAEYCEPDIAENIIRQRNAFAMDQDELEDITYMYASEEVEFLKSLARSYGSVDNGDVSHLLDSLSPQASEGSKQIIESHRQPGGGYLISDELVPIALGWKQETTRNRASLATGDIEITEKIEKKLGKERTYQVASAELGLIKLDVSGGSEAVAGIARSANEMAMAEANVGCEGGCPVALNGQFSSRLAEANKLGVLGTVYHVKEEIEGHKCARASKGKGIYMNEKGHGVCLNCGESYGIERSDYSEAKRKAAAKSQSRRERRKAKMAGRQPRYNNREMGFLDYVIHGEQKAEETIP